MEVDEKRNNRHSQSWTAELADAKGNDMEKKLGWQPTFRSNQPSTGKNGDPDPLPYAKLLLREVFPTVPLYLHFAITIHPADPTSTS